MTTKNENLRTEVIENVGWLTLNRPKYLNAISHEMWLSIPESLSEMHSKGAKVVVISGDHATFASGADLMELEKIDSYAKAQSFWYGIRECLEYIHAFEVPTIAMIDGACIGGGLLMAVACDIRYSSNVATFGLPIAKLGIVLDDSNIARLTELIGPAQAKEMLYTGDTISSAEAQAMGLVNRTVAPAELRELTEKTARKIVGNGYASIIESKRSVRRATSEGDRSGLLPQHETVVVSSYLTSDFRTRIRQFVSD